MNEHLAAASEATAAVWTGRGLSALVIAFLLLDAAMKMVPLAPVIKTSQELGWPTAPAGLRTLAIILIVSVALYAYPATAVLGAILLTGYLGGAVATHVRVGNPLFSHVLFGVYIGAALWLGLFLRNTALHALLWPF